MVAKEFEGSSLPVESDNTHETLEECPYFTAVPVDGKFNFPNNSKRLTSIIYRPPFIFHKIIASFSSSVTLVAITKPPNVDPPGAAELVGGLPENMMIPSKKIQQLKVIGEGECNIKETTPFLSQPQLVRIEYKDKGTKRTFLSTLPFPHITHFFSSQGLIYLSSGKLLLCCSNNIYSIMNQSRVTNQSMHTHSVVL